MKSSRVLASSLVVGALASAVLALAAGDPAKPAAPASKKLARGEYLATTMGCNDCHTPGTLYGAPDFSRKLSGSEMGWQGPWGVTYARNLTPDMETGLGKWSEQDIVKALRTGTRPDGSVLQPPMPWQNFTVLTDDDAFAIAAYLKSLRAVAHKVPDIVPPGQAATGSVLAFPPPSAWDAPAQPPSQQPVGATGK